MSINGRSSLCDLESTSTSLLRLVKSRDQEAWEKLVALYAPLVYSRARKAALSADDAADVVQDVFLAVAMHIHDFKREGPGQGFRRWLHTICHNKIRDYYRRQPNQPRGLGGTTGQQLCQLIEDEPAEEASPEESSETSSAEIRALRKRALELAREKFRREIWVAFWRTAIEGDKPADVARDLGVSVWFVYKAKARVLQRLRQDAEGLESSVQGGR